MRIVTLDFETHYAADYSLSKMSPLEYVMDDRFQTISCSIKVDNHNTDVFFGEAAVRKAFKSADGIIRDSLLLAHNMAGFDAYVCAYRYDLKPKLWGCTMAMARPIHAKTTGLGLAKLVAHYGLGVKDNTVLVQTRGKRLEDFTPQELEAMRKYNREDTDQCRALFDRLRKHYTPAELWQIDAIIRMRTEPAFVLDVPMLETAASIERTRKHKALLDLARDLNPQGGPALDWSDEGAVTEFVRGELASAPKFSAMLEKLGVEVPTKPSPTNPEKTVPALAKTDEAFIALQEHDDPLVSAAARARLDVKSTLLETRIQKFMTAGRLAGGYLPVPLRYCGADTTGRDSGEEYNCQNLPRVNPDKPQTSDALRNSLRAGKGKKVIVADQSGIELRTNHFLWKEPASMALYQASPDKADLYRSFAAEGLYRVPAEQISKAQRQIGKLCLAEGTLILTDVGQIPIEQVSARHRVWDGVEWVSTLGSIFKGVRDVITHDGICATPDHEVWIDDGRKVPLGYAAAQSCRLARTGAAGAPLGFGGAGVSGGSARQGVPARSGAVHKLRGDEGDQLRQPSQRENQGVPELLPEMRRPGVAAPAHGGSETKMHEPQRRRVPPLWRPGGTVPLPDSGCGGRMGEGESGLGALEGAGPEEQRRPLRGGQPALGEPQGEHRQPDPLAHAGVPHFSVEPPRGQVRGYDPTGADCQGAHPGTDCAAVGAPLLQTERRVWDLLNCGPRNRFTANDRLVSNCQLGLGFGSGSATFQRIAKIMGGVNIPLDGTQRKGAELTCEDIVASWRTAYANIVEGWKTCGRALQWIADGLNYEVDPWGLVSTCKEGFLLPSGRLIRYPDLRQEEDGSWPDGRPRTSWFYANGRHKARITGPKSDENLVQALARDSIFDCALEYFKRTGLRPALRVHDELVYVVDEGPAEELLAELQRVMRIPPKWWPELIVWSEGDVADTYGAAK